MLEVWNRRALRFFTLGLLSFFLVSILAAGVFGGDVYVEDDEQGTLQKIDLVEKNEEGVVQRDSAIYSGKEFSGEFEGGRVTEGKIYGYIIEFEEEPLVVKETETREELEKNKEYLSKSSRYNPKNMFVRAFGVTEEEDLEEKIEEHGGRIEEEHMKVKARIAGEIGELGEMTGKGERGFVGNVVRGITGRAVDDSESVEVMGEYKNVFNGIALDVNAEEAEKIKKIKGVKRVEPDYGVRALLSDSVPLIGADKVWERDAEGGECLKSGKECLTGKGVKIAIIDTGVDYTHPDLGNGCYKPGVSGEGNQSGSGGGGGRGLTGNAIKEGEDCVGINAFFDEEIKEDLFALTERLNAAAEKKSVTEVSGAQSLCASEARSFSRQTGDLVEERKELLEKMIEDEPDRALEVPALSEKVVKSLSRSERKELVEERKDVQGYLDVIHVDDFENPENSEFLYYVRDKKSGTKTEVFSNRHLEHGLANSEVKVHGLALGDKMAVGVSAFEVAAMAETGKGVQALGVIEKPKTEQEENLGEQKTLVIVVGFDGKKPPVTVEAARKMVFDKNPGEPVTLKIKKGESEFYRFADMENKIEYKGMDDLGNDIVILNINSGYGTYNLFVGKIARFFDGFTITPLASSTDSEVVLLIEELKVNDYYAENSYGKMNLVGDVVGPYQLPKPSSGKRALEMSLEAVMKDIKNFDYDRVILAMSSADGECGACGSLGKYKDYLLPDGKKASFSVSWDSGFNRGLVGHELGHNFGAHHANSYSCYDKEEYQTAYFSIGCRSIEYGDPYDIMGNSNAGGTFNAPHKSEVGWLPMENTNIASEGTFLIKPINSVQDLGTLQQLRVPVNFETGFYAGRDDIYYSISYKKKTDTDWNINEVGEVFVHLEEISNDGSIKSIQSNVVPLVSSRPYTFDSGKTLLDTLNGISIKLDKIDSEGAHVSVSKIPASSLQNFNEPLIYYDFSEVKDGRVKDKTGNSNGDFIGAIKRFGGAYINGLDSSYIETTDFQATFINKNNAFSALQWVNLRGNFNGPLLEFGGHYVSIASSEISVRADFNSKGSEYPISVYFFSSKRINDEKWHQVVTRYDGKELSLYVDGRKEGGIDYIHNFDGEVKPLDDIHIQSYSRKTIIGKGLKGVLDEFKIYARALSDEEIKREFENFKPEVVDYEKKEPVIISLLVGKPSGFSMGQNDYNVIVNGFVSGKYEVGIMPARDVKDKGGYEFRQFASIGEKAIFGKRSELEVLVDGIEKDNVQLKISPVKKEDQKERAEERCKIIDGYDFANGDNDPMDDQGHGTHVAATAAGKGDENGNGVYDKGELWGVAPDAQILAYKVLGKNRGGSTTGILAAIERAVDPNGDGKFDDKVDIISMSLGGPGNPDDAMSKAVDNAVKAGVVAVVAAGNSGPKEKSIDSPGTAHKAITVGAIDKKEVIAKFSSRGPVIWKRNDNERALLKPDIVAPGVSICAASKIMIDINGNDVADKKRCPNLNGDKEHILVSGTSMATPHVAGVAALIKQAFPTLSPEEIKSVLIATSIKLNSHNLIYHGSGIVDPMSATIISKSVFAELDSTNYEDGKLIIRGGAYGNGFERYTLSYFDLENNEQIICSGKIAVRDGPLCLPLDVKGIDEGYVSLRLQVYGKDGVGVDSWGIANIKHFEFVRAGKLEYLQEDHTVELDILTRGYDKISVEISREGSESWNEFCTILELARNRASCKGNVDGLQDGIYLLRAVAYFGNEKVVGLHYRVAIDSKLIRNWPIGLSGNPQIELIYFFKDKPYLVSDTYVEEPFENAYEIISHEGSSIVRKSERDNSNSPFVLETYSRLEKDYPYIHDFMSTPTGTFFVYQLPVTYFPGEVIGSKSSYTINGFDNNLNLLPGFPIKIPMLKPSGEVVEVSESLGYLEEEGNYKIASTSRNIIEEGKGNIIYKSVLSIYSQEGTIEEEIILGESKMKEPPMPKVAIGDIDGNGEREVVVYFSVYDGSGDLDSYIKVFDSKGKMIASPYKISGHYFGSVIISKFEEEYPRIVAVVMPYAKESTPKVVSFDYQGKIFFQNEAPPSKIFQYVLAGDVTGDNIAEIIVSYEPYGRDRSNSGFLIYDSSGKVENDIVIPAVGYAERENLIFSPILTDLNKDGKLDIVQAVHHSAIGFAKTYRMYALSVSDSVPKQIEWPMYGHDAQRTRCYDCISAEKAKVICGNRVKEVGEECDAGVDNGVCPTACGAECKLNTCSIVTGQCVDEDGLDVGKVGKVIDDDKESKDVCVNGKEVREFYCVYNAERGRASVASYVEQCAGACDGGKCVGEKKECADTDSEDDLSVKGSVTLGEERFEDRCEEEGKSVRQYICDGNKVKSFVKRCPAGTCFGAEGACR